MFSVWIAPFHLSLYLFSWLHHSFSLSRTLPFSFSHLLALSVNNWTASPSQGLALSSSVPSDCQSVDSSTRVEKTNRRALMQANRRQSKSWTNRMNRGLLSVAIQPQWQKWMDSIDVINRFWFFFNLKILEKMSQRRQGRKDSVNKRFSTVKKEITLWIKCLW